MSLWPSVTFRTKVVAFVTLSSLPDYRHPCEGGDDAQRGECLRVREVQGAFQPRLRVCI